MSSLFPTNNASYVTSFNQGHLALPPAKKYIVVTCMDARIEPASQLGINLGDAHVIRNAGGRAEDALRSIIISQRLLGTREIAIFHHTDCGMLTFSTPMLRDLVKKAEPGNQTVSGLVDQIDFQTFSHLEESIKQDVQYLKEHPLVLEDTEITGWVYEVETGKARQIQ
ncbi:hypothetical protein AMATHDRAFT_78373 [Amanita thiersii Skay4041]|uniref:Carbonic anhydrase n=1 Tax=Amanita thiersii Skay4041 TaxID=703135 RepID=A0A2A9NX33_9AGAR|nr:hypothetical protein AMATHDRAFT_78373 [Amanita thiersii Skay4041]